MIFHKSIRIKGGHPNRPAPVGRPSQPHRSNPPYSLSTRSHARPLVFPLARAAVDSQSAPAHPTSLRPTHSALPFLVVVTSLDVASSIKTCCSAASKLPVAPKDVLCYPATFVDVPSDPPAALRFEPARTRARGYARPNLLHRRLVQGTHTIRLCLRLRHLLSNRLSLSLIDSSDDELETHARLHLCDHARRPLSLDQPPAEPEPLPALGSAGR